MIDDLALDRPLPDGHLLSNVGGEIAMARHLHAHRPCFGLETRTMDLARFDELGECRMRSAIGFIDAAAIEARAIEE